jgi:hypothetical protein
MATDRLEDAFWARHSNPKSGWSRVPTGPLLVYAVYRRDARLLAATLVWTGINPLLFAPPESDEAWMTRGVLAERWWVREEKRGTVGPDYPNVCNAVGGLSFFGALLAAWRRQPAASALLCVLASALKLWWVGALVRRYDRERR